MKMLHKSDSEVNILKVCTRTEIVNLPHGVPMIVCQLKCGKVVGNRGVKRYCDCAAGDTAFSVYVYICVNQPWTWWRQV